MFEALPTTDFTAAFQLLERGGPVVAIIGLFSITALTVGLAKLIQFAICGIGRGSGIDRALAYWTRGDVGSARTALEGRRSAVAVALRHGLEALARGDEEARVREDVERVALRGLAELRRYLRIIEATSQVTPLLGLFGTVIGMMGAFQALQAAGSASDPAALAGGIWVALITTAVGLAVAMPATLALYWFEGRIERERTLMEDAVTRLFTGWTRENEWPQAQSVVGFAGPDEVWAAAVSGSIPCRSRSPSGAE